MVFDVRPLAIRRHRMSKVPQGMAAVVKSNVVHHCSADSLLSSLPDESVDMVYTDPPFGTQEDQTMTRRKSGKLVSKMQYSDRYEDYLEFLVPHLRGLRRVLKTTGTMYLHLDQRWSHYVKVLCDIEFGRDNFMNSIVWSYNYGGRSKTRWPEKHDDVLVYAKEIGRHIFNWDDIDRIPYAAPELQRVGRTPEEAARRVELGQVPTDVWSMSIVGTASKERTGYPSQKPLKLVKRCIVASSPPGGLVLDPFVGSGTTAAAALQCGRSFVVSDQNQSAIDTMKKRFEGLEVEFV